MAFSLHGVHVPHRKHTQNKPVLKMDPPQTVAIPMSMHIGAPATPIVKVGDLVKVGQKIAEATERISTPFHASVSGKVTKIVDFLAANGKTVPAVVIESDGEMTVDESIAPPTVTNREQLINAVKESGIVGLGGAGFPTHVKLDVEPESIDWLIVNGAECEPYVTSDTVTMTTRRDDMAVALRALARHLGIKQAVIGIENNKQKAIAEMKLLAKDVAEDIALTVKALPSKYPQGGEKVLVYHTVGREIPAGKLPSDVGCVVLNCTTVAAIGAYLTTGMPLVEKCITVDGGCVANPQNVVVPVGTSMADVFAVCGGLTAQPEKLIYGGPMMGITVPSDTAPVMKNSNAILALTGKEAWLPKTTACIRCGACTNVCPFGLAPAAISHALGKQDAEALESLAVNACMECGCCSFICPANRPLVQNNKLGKAFLREAKAKEDAKS